MAMASGLKGEGKLVHMGDNLPWAVELHFRWEWERVAQINFCETFPKAGW